ncbi:PTS sugar transporter subunit IIB [Spiroplasma chrysopicola]|uniref:Putative PTS system IIB component n=1 Tax=Spiroplasma chrysopicola DF-1 TaxID=1276227 RepID=R4UGZ2_9MOLU|nr:PTS system IIB component [Spiroplasma chrysopicola]AGM25435.1 putative PTS system IIB component [Spiroplasma chrysopicola DF-1]
MKNVCLVCSAGISTKMIVTNINEFLTTHQNDIKFLAVNINELTSEHYDVVLLAPQIGYLKDKITTIFKDQKNVKIEILPSDLYVSNNAEGIINFITNL